MTKNEMIEIIRNETDTALTSLTVSEGASGMHSEDSFMFRSRWCALGDLCEKLGITY